MSDASTLDPFALIAALYILVLAAFVGYEVVSKVPTMLHTPLMSGANAIHGVIVVGAMLVAATAAALGIEPKPAAPAPAPAAASVQPEATPPGKGGA